MKRNKSIVKLTDDGLVYCEKCREMLFCNEFGDMPDVCPKCGRDLDWNEFIRITTEDKEEQEETK